MHAMPNRFSLASTVGRGHLMLRSDVRNTKLRLAELGYVETLEPSTLEVPDDAFFQAIREYQTDHGLTVDGVMRPGGETERTFQTVNNPTGLPGKSYGPIYRCQVPGCGAPHGGVFSGSVCHKCVEKILPKPHTKTERQILDAIKEALGIAGGAGAAIHVLEPLD